MLGGKFLSNETIAKGILTQLCIVSDIELVKDVSVIGAYRFDTERKLPPNLLSRAPPCDPQKDFKLTRGERLVQLLLCRIE